MNLNYKTSKDYALLKKLLDEGKHVICFADYDTMSKTTIKNICYAKKIDNRYTVCARGIEYTYFSKFDEERGFTFESMMKVANIEFIEPTL